MLKASEFSTRLYERKSASNVKCDRMVRDTGEMRRDAHQNFGIMQGLHRSSEELHSNRAQLVMKLFDGTWVPRKGAAPASEVTARESGKPPW